MLYIFWILGMLAFKLAIVDQCQCILLWVRILLANLPPFSTTSETLSYSLVFKYSFRLLSVLAFVSIFVFVLLLHFKLRPCKHIWRRGCSRQTACTTGTGRTQSTWNTIWERNLYLYLCCFYNCDWANTIHLKHKAEYSWNIRICICICVCICISNNCGDVCGVITMFACLEASIYTQRHLLNTLSVTLALSHTF